MSDWLTRSWDDDEGDDSHSEDDGVHGQDGRGDERPPDPPSNDQRLPQQPDWHSSLECNYPESTPLLEGTLGRQSHRQPEKSSSKTNS